MKTGTGICIGFGFLAGVVTGALLMNNSKRARETVSNTQDTVVEKIQNRKEVIQNAVKAKIEKKKSEIEVKKALKAAQREAKKEAIEDLNEQADDFMARFTVRAQAEPNTTTTKAPRKSRG